MPPPPQASGSAAFWRAGETQVADIDKDGRLDIIQTSWDHHLHVWNQSGQELPGFPFFVKDTVWSTPAIEPFHTRSVWLNRLRRSLRLL